MIEATDYVSYKLAQKLKACGFDEPCERYYTHEDAPDGYVWLTGDPRSPEDYNNLQDDCPFAKPICSAPSLYAAQKWLREKKGIAINVIAHDASDKYREGKYHWEEVHLPNSNENGPHWMDWFIYGKHPLFDTYEEALSDGLSQMLKLIRKEG